MKEQGIPKADESMVLFSCYGKLVVIKLLFWKSMIITDVMLSEFELSI